MSSAYLQITGFQPLPPRSRGATPPQTGCSPLKGVSISSAVPLKPANTVPPTQVAVDKKSPPPPVPSARLKINQVRRTIALVVDDLGLSFESIAQVRSSLKKFVDQQIEPGDLVAIMRTGAG